MTSRKRALYLIRLRNPTNVSTKNSENMKNVTITKHNKNYASYDIQLDGEGFFPITGRTKTGRDVTKFFGYKAGADQYYHNVSPGVRALLENLYDANNGRKLAEYVKDGDNRRARYQ